MVAMDSEFDPEPSVRVVDGVIVEMDGRARADFDFLDQFIADHAIDVATTEAVDGHPRAGDRARCWSIRGSPATR